MATWEGSKKDRMMDRRAARKAKMRVRDYESSPADEAADAKAMQKMQGMAKGGTVRGMGAAKRGGRFSVS